MSIESMKRISECEEEAVSIRRQAQADARQILDQGKKQAEELLEAARKQAADDYRATLTQAEAEAGAAYDKSLAEVREGMQPNEIGSKVKTSEGSRDHYGKGCEVEWQLLRWTSFPLSASNPTKTSCSVI